MKKILLIIILMQLCCCSLTTGTRPDISLVDVEFSNASIFETSANFTIRLQNENPYQMDFDGAKYNISLNNINVGKGLVDQNFTIPKLGSVTQTVTIHISNLSLLRNVQTLIDAKNFEYRVDATLFGKGGLGLNNININQSGSFKARY